MNYVLVTTAHNEERNIERLITSVVRQTVTPNYWVIVSDASTDRTEELVSKCSADYPFIRLVSYRDKHQHDFSAQVEALNAGIAIAEDIPHEFIGNLDADVSFAPDYFERLLLHFQSNPALGLAGGFVHDPMGREFRSRPRNTERSVAGAVQTFRRSCWEQIGRYPALPYGGSDTWVEVRARMNGWEVRSFPELVVLHHRPTAGARGLLRGRFKQGRMDYSLGLRPDYELLKCAARILEKPCTIGALTRLLGYGWSYANRERILNDPEFLSYFRSEQRQRMHLLFRKGEVANGAVHAR